MAAIKTYILAPNFTYHPNTSICMGDIIEDPSDPTKPLSSLRDSSFPSMVTHFDYDVKLSKEKSHSLQGSVWAKFLEIAKEKIGGEVGGGALDKYVIDRLETIYFEKQPTDEEAAERIKNEKVQVAMNSCIFGKKPVYMITGLKVARGFRVESGNISESSKNMSLELPASWALSFGSGLSAGSTSNTRQSYRSDQDIVFAYQLHVITCKGWRGKDVQIQVDASWGSFSGSFWPREDSDDFPEDERVSIHTVAEADLWYSDDEMAFEVSQAWDRSGSCACVAFRKE